jgi:hypothetical protein
VLTSKSKDVPQRLIEITNKIKNIAHEKKGFRNVLNYLIYQIIIVKSTF